MIFPSTLPNRAIFTVQGSYGRSKIPCFACSFNIHLPLSWAGSSIGTVVDFHFCVEWCLEKFYIVSCYGKTVKVLLFCLFTLMKGIFAGKEHNGSAES